MFNVEGLGTHVFEHVHPYIRRWEGYHGEGVPLCDGVDFMMSLPHPLW